MSEAYIGVGGNRPGVYRVRLADGALHVDLLLSSPPGQSVYRIAVSPSVQRIAYATKTGQIKVFGLDNALPLERTLLYMTAADQINWVYYGLAFLSEQLLVASARDFQVRLYDLSQPVHKEKIGELQLSGVAFALTAIDETRFAALVREQKSDHLMVWDARTRTRVFQGPAFKMPREYHLSAIDLDQERGLLVHGDRFGGLHLYDINNGFAHRLLSTGHGNWYALAFNDGQIFTAGHQDDGAFRRWDFEGDKPAEEAALAGLPVAAMTRLDKDHLLAVLATGQILLVNHRGVLSVRDRKDLANIRHLTGMPAHHVISLESEARKRELRETLNQIQTLFETGRSEQAYQAIAELERRGFAAEAMQALAVAERAQGLLLNELEALLALVHGQPLVEELLPQLRRLADVLEMVHEPELAILTLGQILELEEDADIISRIEKLKDRCVEGSEIVILLAGSADEDGARAEIRKAEILNRFFVEAILIAPEEVSLRLPCDGNFTLDCIATEMSKQEISRICHPPELIQATCKRGGQVSPPGCWLRIRPADTTLTPMEAWIELRHQFGDWHWVLSRVLYPGSENPGENWNQLVLENFERLLASPALNDWFAKVKSLVGTAILDAGDRHATDHGKSYF